MTFPYLLGKDWPVTKSVIMQTNKIIMDCSWFLGGFFAQKGCMQLRARSARCISAPPMTSLLES